jgi:hypothetical protein
MTQQSTELLVSSSQSFQSAIQAPFRRRIDELQTLVVVSSPCRDLLVSFSLIFLTPFRSVHTYPRAGHVSTADERAGDRPDRVKPGRFAPISDLYSPTGGYFRLRCMVIGNPATPTKVRSRVRTVAGTRESRTRELEPAHVFERLFEVALGGSEAKRACFAGLRACQSTVNVE